MSYETDLNKAGSTSKRRVIELAPSSNSSGRDGASAHYKFYELEAATVVSVNLTDSNPTNIGKAIVRPIVSHKTTPESNLPEAWPLDSNVKSYPLVGEVVIVAEYPTSGKKQLYYFQRLNYFNLINQNIVTVPPPITGTVATTDYASTAFGNPNVSQQSAQPNNPGGVYFAPNKNIRPLLPMEGDVIYEGRFGNSIRLGNSVPQGTNGLDKRFNKTWANGPVIGSPITIIRNGQATYPPKPITSVVEDINKDKTSIYLTSDQTIPLNPASKNQKSYRGTYPSVWDGAQAIIASDRIIFNAKKDGVYLIAPKTIGLSTDGTVNIDAGNLCIISSPTIALGLNASEPLLKGNQWLKIMIKLLTALQTETHPSPSGTTGYPVNASTYADLINELQNALSNVSVTE